MLQNSNISEPNHALTYLTFVHFTCIKWIFLDCIDEDTINCKFLQLGAVVLWHETEPKHFYSLPKNWLFSAFSHFPPSFNVNTFQTKDYGSFFRFFHQSWRSHLFLAFWWCGQRIWCPERFWCSYVFRWNHFVQL